MKARFRYSKAISCWRIVFRISEDSSELASIILPYLIKRLLKHFDILSHLLQLLFHSYFNMRQHRLSCLDAFQHVLNSKHKQNLVRSRQLGNQSCFARYSGFIKMNSPVELHSRPNVSTLQSSVFIRGDLKSQRGFLNTQEVTSFGDTPVVNNYRHLYSDHDDSC